LALLYLRNRYPSAPFLGIGFSLGGSVLARYLGESGTLSVLDSAVVVGCPWHIPSMSHTLETGFFVSRIYSRALGSNLMQLFKRHYEANPDMWNEEDNEIAKLIPDLERLTKRGRHTRLKEVDQFFTTKLGGPRDEGTFPFDTADDYYQWASSDQHLSAIKVYVYPLLLC
jgi:predicted alpha/beta-fold hydrolase